MKRWQLEIGLIFSLLLLSCNSKLSKTRSGLEPKKFQTIIEGKATNLYILNNKNGMEVCVTNYGGRIVSIIIPDKKKKLKDVVLGFDSIGDYLRHPTDLGAIIGRYSGCIHKGHISIDNKIYRLSRNNAGDCIDGGEKSFQDKVFDTQQISNKKLVLTYISKNEENGFPGNLICSITYKLTDDNALDIYYNAETDYPTEVNITNRIYFNLSGNPSKLCTDEQLFIHSKYYLPIDKSLIPIGKLAKVSKSPMNFRKAKLIGKNINEGWFSQLQYGQGYNHYYILDTQENISRIAAELRSPDTGIMLKIYTTEPGIQFYSGNAFDGTMKGKHGIIYNQHAGIVLATQKFPDAPNHPEWPSTLLKPGQKYIGHTLLKFSISQ